MNRRLKYASFCSGVECISVACRGLPLDPVFFSEIEPFPCAVLKANYPTIPNLGDMSKIRRDKNGNITNGTTTIPFPDGGIDILAAGCPCQDFSIAGKRAGGAEGSGTRSSLIFEFIRIIGEIRPRWFIYENVVGMLSSNEGRDFAHILLAFRDCGYSVCYRTLDAQYVRVDGMERAVPQRRRRVWVVGCLGADESVPAQILFEPDCVAGHTAPRRRTGKGFAYSLARRDRVDAPVVGSTPGDGGGEARASARGGQWQAAEHGSVGDGGHLGRVQYDGGGREREAGGVGDGGCEVLNFQGSKGNNCVTDDGSCPNLNAMHGHDVHVVALEGNGQRPSHKGTGINDSGASFTLNHVEQHGVAYGIGHGSQGGSVRPSEEAQPTLVKDDHKGPMPAVVQCFENNTLNHSEVCRTLTGNHDDRVTDTGTSVVISTNSNGEDMVVQEKEGAEGE